VKHRIVLIGPGRLGQAVTRLLCDAGHEICAVISQDLSRARAAARFIGAPDTVGTTDLIRARQGDLVLLALPDDHIARVAAILRRDELVTPGAVLIHFSGIHHAGILLGEEGPAVKALAIHPLQTFADAVIGVKNLPGSLFAVQGDEELYPLALELVEDMGGIPFMLTQEQKPLYHAAACMTSNYLVTLVDTAGQILEQCGIPKPEACRLLWPLLRGTMQNLTALTPETALTGPIVRGDARTVEKHLKALEDLPEDLGAIYRVLGKKTVELALRSERLEQERAEEIRKILES